MSINRALAKVTRTHPFFKNELQGHLGGWLSQMSDLSSGHDLVVHEFKPLVGAPPLGSVLTVQSLKPATDSVPPSLPAPPLLTLCLSLSLSKINKDQKNLKTKRKWLRVIITRKKWSLCIAVDVN